jgi:hypothetical protein
MTSPIEPLRPPLVEPTVPARPVARRHEEHHDEQPSHRRREDGRRRDDEAEEEPGLHVDVLA